MLRFLQLQDPGELVYSSNIIVQHYVKNPLLIGGYKFDLRLYVLVPSFRPLTVYIYREGLVRFGTEKFSLSNLNNRFAHLTNSSLNKFGPGYLETKERVGAGKFFFSLSTHIIIPIRINKYPIIFSLQT